jgi:flagellar biosynthesis component FlhA
VAIALLTGPYPWARTLRRWVVDGGKWVVAIGRATVDRTRDDATVDWFRSHIDLFRIGGVVLAVILLIVLSVSFVGFLVIAVLLAAYEYWLWHFRESHPTDAETGSATESEMTERNEAPSAEKEPSAPGH